MARHRYDLTDAEWKIIEPLLPQKSRGVERVDDRRVLNGIFWRLRSDVGRNTGAIWALDNLLQPFRALAEGRHLGATVERDLRCL